tara:strand:+ start:99 stop:1169 length:1071 start_codon:yes stop_codon:yes gene_type:complete
MEKICEEFLKQAKKLEKKYGSWDKVPNGFKMTIEKNIPNIKDQLENWEKDNSIKAQLIRRITNKENGLLIWIKLVGFLNIIVGGYLLLIDINDSLNGLGVLIIFMSLTYLIWRSLFISCNFCLFQILKIGMYKEIHLISSGYSHTKKSGGIDNRFKNNTFNYHYNEILPCYNCDRKIIHRVVGESLPERKISDITTSFSYKYNSLVKKIFISTFVLLIVIPIIVEGLENSPYQSNSQEAEVTEYAIELKNEVIESETEEIEEEITTELKLAATEEYYHDQIESEGYGVLEENVILYKVNDPDGWSNLRQKPAGRIIRTLDTLERFRVIKINDSWALIKLNNGTIGYIHKSRIILTD